jgi:hypothetical protein
MGLLELPSSPKSHTVLGHHQACYAEFYHQRALKSSELPNLNEIRSPRTVSILVFDVRRWSGHQVLRFS